MLGRREATRGRICPQNQRTTSGRHRRADRSLRDRFHRRTNMSKGRAKLEGIGWQLSCDPDYLDSMKADALPSISAQTCSELDAKPALSRRNTLTQSDLDALGLRMTPEEMQTLIERETKYLRKSPLWNKAAELQIHPARLAAALPILEEIIRRDASVIAAREPQSQP